MNHPFEITFAVEEINQSDETKDLIESQEYHINATLTHTIADLKHLVWIRSENFALKPVFLTFKYGERRLNDNEILCDILQTPEVPLQLPNGFSMVVDYSLFHSRSIPQRDPDQELFDIIIQLNDNNGVEHTIRLRESLGTTVGVLKGYLIEEATKRLVNRELRDTNFALKLKSSGEIFNDNSLALSKLLRLDVTPLHPISFQIANTTPATTTPDSTSSPQIHSRRFHIKIESEVSTLQRENNLFEVNKSTTLHEFKQQIIERMDHFSVRRTFEEQIKLRYEEQIITNATGTIVSLLGLTDEFLAQHRIIRLNLEVTNHVSGASGLLRDFWSDLRPPDQFDYLPSAAAEPRPQTVEPMTSEAPILPIEPTRIVIEDGVEWHLIGESYERIRPNGIDRSSLDLLVDQSDLSTLDYEFTLKVGGEIRSVVLNTSQCIIVDNENHTPYLLLSPAGAAKLCGKFHLIDGQPLIQQVQVLMYGDASIETRPTALHVSARINRTTFTPTPTTNTGVRTIGPVERVLSSILRVLNTLFGGYQAIGTRVILFILKALVIIKILGIHIPSQLWKPALLYGLVFSQLYVLLFAGVGVATRIEELFATEDNNETPAIVVRVALGFARFVRFTSGATSGLTWSLRDELITILVNRTRDYEYILDGQEGNSGAQLLYKVADEATNAWKDVVLCGLTIIPNWDGQIEDELEKWRQGEVPELQRKVRLYAELVLELTERYNSKFAPAYVLPSGLELDLEQMQFVLEEPAYTRNETPPTEELAVQENRFQVLIHYYRELEKVFDKVNRAIVTDLPMENGTRIIASPEE